MLKDPRVARRSATVAAGLLAAIVAVHLYWALGGTIALHALSRIDDASSTGGRIFYAVIAALAVPVALELLALTRAVALAERFPTSRRLVWALAGLLAIGGVARAPRAPVIGIVAIVLALLFALVARSSPRREPEQP